MCDSIGEKYGNYNKRPTYAMIRHQEHIFTQQTIGNFVKNNNFLKMDARLVFAIISVS